MLSRRNCTPSKPHCRAALSISRSMMLTDSAKPGPEAERAYLDGRKLRNVIALIAYGSFSQVTLRPTTA
jgi:hypothetical protein